MSLIDRLGRFFARRKIEPQTYSEIRLVPFGNVNVRLYAPEDALKVSTAWRCVRLLADTTAAFEWRVKRRTDDGNSLDQDSNRINWLLSHRANDEMGSFDFRRTIAQHLLLYGNGYAEIQRDSLGRPVALWPIGPDRVDPQRMYEDGSLFYRVSNFRGGFSEMDPNDIFHVRSASWDGIRGYSIMEVAATSLQGAAGIEGFGAKYFSNGMNPSGVISVPPTTKLSPEGVKRLQAEVAERHAGPNNSGKPLILDGGMEWKPLSSDPEKAQFLDTRKFSVYDVCRWFGVPPYLAFASDEQPRANVATQSREFWAYGLMPVVKCFEQEANFKLLRDEFGGLYTKMEADELLRADYEVLARYYETMRRIGVFTVNDVLKMEGMNTIGPEGDVRHMQVQNQPIGPDGAPKSVEPAAAPRNTNDGGDAGAEEN